MDNLDDMTSRLALLVLDMQPAFLKAIEGSDVCLQRTLFAVKAAKLLGIRVFFTEQVPDKLGATDASLLEAAGEGAPVFGKTSFSAMRAEGVPAFLEDKGVEHLLIAGIETPICLYQTCVDAAQDDLDVTVLSDCATGRRAEDCMHVEQTLRENGTHWMPSETVFYSMLGDATHPLFKNFTKLVKDG